MFPGSHLESIGSVQKIFELVLHFLHSSVLTSPDYINELLALADCKSKFEISVRDKLIGIKKIPELVRALNALA